MDLVHQHLEVRLSLVVQRGCLAIFLRKALAHTLKAPEAMHDPVALLNHRKYLIESDQHPPGRVANDPHFQGFEEFNGRGYRGTNNRQLDAQYYYAIGFHLALLLDRIDAGWRACVHTRPGRLLGVSLRLAAAESTRACD